MAEHSLVANLVLTYGIALLLVVTLAQARVPTVVALMVAGVIAGPSVLGVFKTPEEVEMLAELGVVLLLFTVGLDFSLAAMRQIWRTILVAGTLQIAGTAAVVALFLVLIGQAGLPLGIFIGLFVALSSTAIVLKGLVERNRLSAPHGRLTVGILLLQDLGHRRAPAAGADSLGSHTGFQRFQWRSDGRCSQLPRLPAPAGSCCRRSCAS